MRVRPTIGVMVDGDHLDPRCHYELPDPLARQLIAEGRAAMSDPELEPTPPGAVEVREPASETRDPKIRRR